MFTHSPSKPLIKRALNYVESIIKTALFSQKGVSLLTFVTIRIVPYPTYLPHSTAYALKLPPIILGLGFLAPNTKLFQIFTVKLE